MWAVSKNIYVRFWRNVGVLICNADNIFCEGGLMKVYTTHLFSCRQYHFCLEYCILSLCRDVFCVFFLSIAFLAVVSCLCLVVSSLLSPSLFSQCHRAPPPPPTTTRFLGLSCRVLCCLLLSCLVFSCLNLPCLLRISWIHNSSQ